MAQPRIDWRSLSYRPNDTLRAVIVVPDTAYRPPHSLTWVVFYNAAPVSSGSGTEVVVHDAAHGVYKVEATVVDYDGVRTVTRSAVSVSGGTEARAVLPPEPFTGSMIQLGVVYAVDVKGPAGTPSGAPAQLAGVTQMVYLLPGTTHISFALDPDQAVTNGDVVVRTRAGNWALMGGTKLGTEDLGFSYRVDPDEPVPAPKDLKLQLTTEVYHVSGPSHAAFNVRAKVICWHKGPQLYRYQACPYTTHPGGAAGLAGAQAARLVAFFEEMIVVGPDGMDIVYSIPYAYTIPGTRMASSGLPSKADRSTGLGFTEANRGVIYEAMGLPDLDAFAVAGIPGARPCIVSIERGGFRPVIPRIKRVRGRLLLYANGAPLRAGTKVTVSIETGVGVQAVEVTVPSYAYASEPDTFALVGAAGVDLADFQFSQTGLVTSFTLDETLAQPPPSVVGPTDPRVGSDHVYSLISVEAFNFAGVCYVNPEPRRLIEDVEALARQFTQVSGCEHSSCGPQGLYCYSNETPPPTVNVVATVANATEGGANGLFTFTRTGPTDTPLTVFFTVSGSATSGTDYTPLGTFVSFGVGTSTVTKSVVALNDSFVEVKESVTLSITANPAYLLGTSTATVFLLDNTPVVTVVGSGTAATEDGTPTSFSFVRTGPTTGALTVNFTVSGSATSGIDYTPLGTSVTFNAGQAVTAKTVTALPDAFIEGVELVILTLAPGTGYAIGNPSIATVYINDTTPIITVVATDPHAAEGGDTGLFTFSRTTGAGSALTVNFTVGGSATAGTDYTSLGTTVTFSVGQLTATKVVTVLQDAAVEGTETVAVTVQPGAGYAVGNPSVAYVDIVDDDQVIVEQVVTVVATDDLASEAGNDGTFTFHRDNTTNLLIVNFSVGGSAVSGTDYESLGTTVSFAAGQADVTKTVKVYPDAVVENYETVEVTLATGSGYVMGSPRSAVVSIQDVMAMISVSATDSAADVATLDPGMFTFSRSGLTGFSLDVYFTVAGGADSAIPGTDYEALPTKVTFAVGQNKVDVAVTPKSGATIQGTKDVIVDLTPAFGYENDPAASQAIVEITGHLVTIQVLSTGSVVNEAGGAVGGFQLQRLMEGSAYAIGNLEVRFTLEGSSAILGDDYTFHDVTPTPTEGVYKITIPNGASSVIMNVDAIQDNIHEDKETVILHLVSGDGYEIGDPSTQFVDIIDDDPAVTATLRAVLNGGVAVDANMDDGTLVNFVEYTLTSWRAALETPPLTPEYYIDGSGGDHDPFDYPDRRYSDMLKDVLNRASGKTTFYGMTEVDGSGNPIPLDWGGRDPALPTDPLKPTDYDGFTAPTWVYDNHALQGWSHTNWPRWQNVLPTATKGWYATVWYFKKSENTTVVPGKWDLDQRRAVVTSEVGVMGSNYTATIRVRGIAQKSLYVNRMDPQTGTLVDPVVPVSGLCVKGGMPDNTHDDYVKLTLSDDPETVYYLNSGGSRTAGNVAIDYDFTVDVVRGGTLITLEINNQDGFQYRTGLNNVPVDVPVPPSSPPPSDTFWIQLDIALV